MKTSKLGLKNVTSTSNYPDILKMNTVMLLKNREQQNQLMTR
jgi:hypothetical protein